MESIFTISRKSVIKSALFLVLALFIQTHSAAQTVPVFANTISAQDNVDNPNNATDNSLSTKASVRAGSGVAVGIGAYSGFIELEFPATLPANTTTYVKVDADDNLFPALLGGTLGGLLSNVLGTVLIGNQEFSVEAKNGATTVLVGHSQIANSFATNNLRIVVNAQNEYFIALTPSLAYNRIRLTNRVGSLLGLNNTKNLGVYGAFYAGTADVCGSATYTSFDGSGLNLDLLGLGGAGVTNPHHVIDANPNNFSRLSLGILGVAASIRQTVYFDGYSQASDQFLIRMKVDPSLLALGVANNIQIIGYNNGTAVQTVNLNSLLNLDLLTLLQTNQVATIPFAPNVPVNRIAVQYSSLLNVQLTQSLDLYDIKRVPPPPTITDPFTANARICAGNTASLVAQTIAGTVLHWYAQPSGGTILATTNSGQPFMTPVLTANTSYYVAAMRPGCPEESLRVRILVNVTSLPVASDIQIVSPQDACNGFVVLSPASSIGGATFKYYKDPLRTTQITTGYSGDAGVTYTVNNTTGQLTISGLTAVNSPYTYYISLTANGCENAPNTLEAVTVNYSSGLTLTVSAALQGCGSVDLTDAILNFNTSGDIQYNFFDALNNSISLAAATNITTSGTYLIQSVSLLGGCASLVQQVVVTVNTQPTLVIPNQNLMANVGDTVTLVATSTSPITWYDANGNALPSNVAGPFTTAGVYTFTAVATSGLCSAIGTITVTVLNPANCPAASQRVYADSQSWGSILTGGVVDAGSAVDGNPRSFSTIVTGLGLLGVGTTWQTLQWDSVIAAGTPLHLKLGSQYSGLVLAGAYSVVGTKRNGAGIPVDIGVIQPVSVSLLDLLAGENSFEFTFVPSDITGPKAYDGVRIIVGSVVSVAQNVKVYEAYYDNTVSQIDCALGDVEDVFSGAVDLGVGVATATVGVDDPYDAVDNSLTSYASLYSGAGILAAADLTVSFTTPTLAGDRIEIMLSRPATILDLNVLTGFSIQLYYGNTAVGSPISNTSSLLSLVLLNGGAQAMLTVAPQNFIYDRIRIRFGGVASVLDVLRVHDINRRANTQVIGADPTNTVGVCVGENIQLQMVPQNCVTFIWYDAPVGGNIVSTGLTFLVPSTLLPGTYNYYIQPVRYGCETYDRGLVRVIVGPTTPANAISQVLINGGNNTNLCSTTGNVTLTAVLNSSVTLTNPVFHWYVLNGTTQQLVTGQTSNTLALTNLAPGTYTYFVGVSSTEYCQTAEADRAQVTFTILPFSQPSDITANDVSICVGSSAVITPTTTQPNPQFTYYFSNNNSQPITNGTVGGVTYTVAANGTLTISGLAVSGSPYTYYVGLTSSATCMNQNGNFEAVTVTVNNGTTPSTTATAQTFCAGNNPTVADIQVNEPNVTWYDAPSAGNALASDTPLMNGGIYYGSIVNGSNCPSTIRLQVTVTLSNGITPTTVSANQSFCAANNPTIANIQVNEPNVTWYDAPSAGNVIPATTALVNNGMYYASITDGFGCPSSVRLLVRVTISNGTTPTTTSTNQTFCSVNNPTVANIQVNEPNVIWYDAPLAGNVVAPATALVNGSTYYGSLTDGNGCVSITRLAVTVTISNGATPTAILTTQTFCNATNPTIANIQINEPNVTFYDAPTAGNILASSTALVNNGVYYASIVDAFGCASAVRLQITVILSSGATPTTTSSNQNFCAVNNPTVANIQVNEANVSWFTMPNGGTALAPTTALVSGTIYYGSLFDGTGCESPTRLQVTVFISNGTTPTTTATAQNFCGNTNPTVSNIQVNESGVSWFSTPTGGTALAANTALTDGGVYYASIIDGFGCASSIRLVVTVTFTPAVMAVITPSTAGNTCLSDQVTYTTNAGMSNYTWTITGGTITAGGQSTDNFVTVSWTGTGAAAVNVSFDNSCGVTSSATFNLTVLVCSDLTISKTVNNPTPMIGENVTFTITVNNVGTTNMSNVVVTEVLSSGYGFVSATPSAGTYSNLTGVWNIPAIAANQSVTLTVVAQVQANGNYNNIAAIITSQPIDSNPGNNDAEVATEPLCLIVYNEFSPNGDGANEVFVIDCIQNYPDNKFEVFNRYGVLVYSKKRYQNDWDGRANVSGTVNVDDKLPAGTYYYVLDIGVNEVKKNGWLSIVR